MATQTVNKPLKEKSAAMLQVVGGALGTAPPGVDVNVAVAGHVAPAVKKLLPVTVTASPTLAGLGVSV